METEKTAKAAVIARLRQEIQSLESFRAPSRRYLQTGIAEIDNSFPDKTLPLASIHELIAHTPEARTATGGFLSALVGAIAGNEGAVIWIVKSLHVFPASLKPFGIDPDRVVFMELPKPEHALWAMEDALRCKGLTAVVCEVADPGMTATRRMQLAVEDSGVTGFLLRMMPKKMGSTACVARWQVTPAPSKAIPGVPGIGFPRWNVELVKARNGTPGQWPVEWKDGALQLSPLPQAQRHAGNLAVAG